MIDASLPVARNGVPTGIAALDDILAGGYEAGRVHLIEGRPGSGKTTLALQFLLAARERGERALYITLSESIDELRQSAATHGWDLEGIDLFELVPAELSLDPSREQSVVYASDLELGETVSLVMEAVQRVQPHCIVFDSLSDIRLLAATSLRYRRQVLALKHFFSRNGATTLFVDDLTEEMDDANLHSLVHGVIRLEQLTIAFGAERRRLRVHKMRGRAFRGGFHDYVIRRGGLQVFTRLVAADHMPRSEDEEESVPSGIIELDRMLGGGLERGTSSLIMGPAGSGKSTLALQYAMTAVKRNERAIFLSFDETRRNFLRRANGLGIRPDQVPESLFAFQQVDPAELSPGELSGLVRAEVLDRGTRVVVLDSLSGYQHAMPEEQFMLLQMHELLTFLNQRGVLTILVLAQHGLVGPMQTPVDLTYLSDTVLLLRFFEAAAEMRRAISVLKKRTGGHESTIREYRIDAQGIRVGEPLRQFSGVLTGVPSYAGQARDLLVDRDG
ncbi:ATPase domain-containing protein [Sabulicella rubraurantiaca]|uniref:ATPase domain-containing protein n=1 Tax=Sabulicella rubraurantiaca TaxID=2811429 RepID=UPI001A9630DB|nr:ATPase domain-containing protein [Sabulicella rubraurantiaca]